MIKSIHIDYRGPRSKYERGYFGLTTSDKTSADVFLNVNKHKKSDDLVNTFFHEMAHVFFAFHGKKRQMTAAEEERLAQQVGRICAGVLR